MTTTDAFTELRAALTVEEAAAYLALSPSTLYRLMKSGQVPFSQWGRTRRISRAWLDQAIADGMRFEGRVSAEC